MAKSATTVSASGNNTGIVVQVIEQLEAGKRPPVLVDLNGYEYRATAAVMFHEGKQR